MRSASSYQKEIQRLRALLAAVEWVQPVYNGAPSCSCCGHMRHVGHAPDCMLVAALNWRPRRRARAARQ